MGYRSREVRSRGKRTRRGTPGVVTVRGLAGWVSLAGGQQPTREGSLRPFEPASPSLSTGNGKGQVAVRARRGVAGAIPV